MCPLNNDRADRLIEIAKQRFDSNLLPAELKVLHESASSDDPQIPGASQQRLPVRPEFLRWLSTDKEAADSIDPKGIRVVSATIAGQLDLSFCRIPSMLVFRHCTFQGLLLLLHTELRGLGIYTSSASEGIVAHGAVLHGPLFLSDGFQSSGPVDFHSARIEGSIQCSRALLTSGHPLSFEGADVRGDIFLTNGFQSSGEVRLLGAKIDGDFSCEGASFNAIAGGRALSLDRTHIRGNVFFTNCNSSATLSLPEVQIGGQLNCRAATLGAPDTALVLDGATIKGGADMQDLKSSGELRLVGADIVSVLNCSRAVLTATPRALSLDRANIQGSVFFRGLKSSGAVWMSSSHIEHNLDCRGATLTALYCRNMNVGGEVIWTSIQNPKEVQLNLAAASMHNLSDDKDSWPSRGNLVLDGLVYDALSLHPSSSAQQLAISNLSNALPLNADERIAWLRLQSLDGHVEPQPWMELSKLFEAKGDKKGAKHVIFALRQEQAKSHGLARRLWNTPLALLEESPARVLWSLAILIFLATCVFGQAARDGAMAPTEREAYTAWATGKPLGSAYPRFQPFIYAVEDALPLVRLGQDDKWAPDSGHRPATLLTGYRFLTGLRWFLILFGWFQATLLATAIGSRFKP